MAAPSRIVSVRHARRDEDENDTIFEIVDGMKRRGLLRGVLPLRARSLFAEFLDGFVDIYGRKSYSQEGEDMILRRMFEGKARGFYVDVGAHHPRRFSNTYFFYVQGWTGINIEPNPDAIRAFESSRRNDINVQVGISDRSAVLTYHQFDEPALNTFDADLVKWRVANTPYKVIRTIDVPVERLENVLRGYLRPNQEIDFLSIDVEGMDMAVLRSNDWESFRPTCVLVEALASSIEDVVISDVFSYMKHKGYELLGKTFNTLVFREKLSGARELGMAGAGERRIS